MDKAVPRLAVVVAVITSIAVFVSNSYYGVLDNVFAAVVEGYLAWALVRLVWWGIKNLRN